MRTECDVNDSANARRLSNVGVFTIRLYRVYPGINGTLCPPIYAVLLSVSFSVVVMMMMAMVVTPSRSCSSSTRKHCPCSHLV